MKVRQEKDGSVNIIMSDEEMDSIKKNNNTFHLGVKKLRHSLNILFTCLFEINKKLPKEIQALSTDLNYKDKT